VLQYLVRLLRSNDQALCDFGKDLVHISAAGTVTIDSLSSDMKALENELQSVYETAKRQAEELEQLGMIEKVKLSELKEQRTSVRSIESVPQYNQIDHMTGRTVMERFALSAARAIEDVKNLISKVQADYVKVLEYLCEDEGMASNEFFGTMKRFVTEFDRAVEHVAREEKAKVCVLLVYSIRSTISSSLQSIHASNTSFVVLEDTRGETQRRQEVCRHVENEFESFDRYTGFQRFCQIFAFAEEFWWW